VRPAPHDSRRPAGRRRVAVDAGSAPGPGRRMLVGDCTFE